MKYWRIISTSIFLCWMGQHSLTKPPRKTEPCWCSGSSLWWVTFPAGTFCHPCSLRGSVEKVTQQNLIVTVIKCLQICYSHVGKKTVSSAVKKYLSNILGTSEKKKNQQTIKNKLIWMLSSGNNLFWRNKQYMHLDWKSSGSSLFICTMRNKMKL